MDDLTMELKRNTESYWDAMGKAEMFSLLRDFYLGEGSDLFRREINWIRKHPKTPDGKDRLPSSALDEEKQ